MSQIVTQTTDEILQVLLIANQGYFSTLVKNFLSNYRINVQQVDYAFFSSASSPQQLNQTQFYKIIYLFNLDDQDKSNFYPIVQFLQKRFESIIVISKITSSTASQDLVFQAWSESGQQEDKYFQYLIKNLEKANFFIGLDLLTMDENWAYPIKACITLLKRKIIIDPQQSWYLLTAASFFDQIKKQLIKPHKAKKYLIKGLKVSTTTFCANLQKVYQLYFNQELKIIKFYLAAKEFNQKQFICSVVESDWQRLLDQKIRVLPSLKVHLDIQAVKDQDLLTLSAQKKKLSSPRFEKDLFEKDLDVNDKKAIFQKTRIKKDILPIQSLNKTVPKEPNENKKIDQFDDQIKNIFNQGRLNYQIGRTVDRFNQITRISFKSRNKKIIFFGGLIFIFLGLMPICLLLFFNFSKDNLKNNLIKYFSQSLNQPSLSAENQSIKTFQQYSFLNKQVNFLNSFFEFETVKEAQEFLTITQKINDLNIDSQELNNANLQLLDVILGRSEQSFSQCFNTLSILSQQFYEELSFVQAELKALDLSHFQPEDSKIIEEYQQELTDLKSQSAVFEQLKAFYPQIFAVDHKKTYALVLQNNFVVRSTGGAVEMLALLTFDQGVLIDSQFFNVYQIDDQITGEIQAPAEISTFLKEQQYYLKDSSWDVDFLLSAERMRWFIRESLDQEVDGVIAVNFFLVRDILEDLESVNLADYHETITSKNLFERLEFHAADKNYSTALVKAIFNQLTNISDQQLLAVLKNFNQSLIKKQSYLAMADVNINKTLNNIGWTGTVINPECPPYFSQANCFIDSIFQIENNIGSTRVSNDIQRTVSQQIEVKGNVVLHQRKINFKNQAQSQLWPQGDYQALIKFILPKEAELKEITINNQLVDNQQILNYLERDKRVIAVPISVAIQSATELKIIYQVPLTTSPPFSYLFFDQKQSGIEETPYHISITHQAGIKPILIAPSAQVKNKTIEFYDDRLSHTFVGVSFE